MGALGREKGLAAFDEGHAGVRTSWPGACRVGLGCVCVFCFWLVWSGAVRTLSIVLMVVVF